MMSETVKLEDNDSSCVLCTRELYKGKALGDFGTPVKLLLRYLGISRLRRPPDKHRLDEDDVNNEKYFRIQLERCLSQGSTENGWSLCEHCSPVMRQFWLLYQNWEGIRLQIDKCVGSLSSIISSGPPTTTSSGRVDSFETLLKTEITRKCSRRGCQSIPHVAIKRRKLDNVPKTPKHGGETDRRPVNEIICLKSDTIKGETTSEFFNENDDDDDYKNSLSSTYKADPTDFLPQSPPQGSTLRIDTICSVSVSTPQTSDSVWDNITPTNSPPPVDPLEDEVDIGIELIEDDSNFPHDYMQGADRPTDGRRCKICNKTFEKPFLLRRHFVTTHFDTLVPREVREKFEAKSELVLLILRASQEFEFPSGQRPMCHFCEATFSDGSVARSHILEEHIDKILEKLVCSRQIVTCANGDDGSPSSLTAHLSVAEKLRCTYCEKLFYSTYYLNQHMKVHSGENPYQCQFCKKPFSMAANRMTHLLQRHALEYFADKLPPGTTKETLRKALDLVTVGRRLCPQVKNRFFGCPYCERGFPRPVNLRQHILDSHFQLVLDKLKTMSEGLTLEEEATADKGHTVYQCAECGKRCTSQQHLIQHLVLHNGEEHFTCDYCGHVAATVGNHRIHVKLVHPVEFFGDKLPPGSTKEGVDIALRKAIEGNIYHIDDDRKQPYGCQFCPSADPKRFPTVSGLRTHMVQHHVSDWAKLLPNANQTTTGETSNVEASTSSGERMTPRVKPRTRLPASTLVQITRHPNQHLQIERRIISNEVKTVPQKLMDTVAISTFPTAATFVCEHCNKATTTSRNHRNHMIATHPHLYFAEQLPPHTSKEAVQAAVDAILESTKQSNGNSFPNGQSFKCPVCFKVFTKSAALKTHVLGEHIDLACQVLRGETVVLVQKDEVSGVVDEERCVVVVVNPDGKNGPVMVVDNGVSDTANKSATDILPQTTVEDQSLPDKQVKKKSFLDLLEIYD